MKHTPGSWTIESSAGHPHKEIWASEQRLAYLQDHHVDNEANARLIAAAPELLEACHLAQLLIESGYPRPLSPRDRILLARAMQAINSALAKAKGNS